MRINKYLAACGICSRREADRYVAQGRVLVNGKTAVNGTPVSDEDNIIFDGKTITRSAVKTYLVFHKPKGIVCTFEKRESSNLIDYLNYPKRITYAGRLDRDTEGLLLLTDDGELIDALMRAKNGHEKEYVVTATKAVSDELLHTLSKGVYLEELAVKTRPCLIKRSGPEEFHITLTQGLNRQIRRMCETVGIRIKSLKRIRIENLKLEDLPVGKYRDLTEEELQELKKRIYGE